tara:strand:- start:139 stop:1359 length:1221 start_codon:yes stop_codon:yes gene_type:complete
MKIKICRLCESKKFFNLLNLGKLSYTGKFATKFSENIPKAKVAIVMCKKCRLVQLDRSFNPKYLYSKDYGYRTGINTTMTEHVKKVVISATKKVKLKKNDYVLDIASNDGTLLSFYPNNIAKVGIDPIINNYKKFYNKKDYKINDFFNYKILKKKINKKFKIITALSVFYDLKNPNKFVADIKKILEKNGVFILEHADLLSILKNNLFDTICHEHLEYYSSKIIINIMKKNNLRVFDFKKNNINGGSTRYYISHNNSNFKNNKRDIHRLLKEEKKYMLGSQQIFKKFKKNLISNKKKLMNFIYKIKKTNKKIHGYGASTKGNVLLQYFKINNKHLDFIADRNPKKYNKYTPGTKIKIISEKKSRKIKPDYYLVLPWHFKDEIIKRERLVRKYGTKLIFPLPKMQIV